MGSGGMRSEDLERIRRSLAMIPSLPGPAATQLLDEVTRLRGQMLALESEVDGMIAALRRVQQAAQAAGHGR